MNKREYLLQLHKETSDTAYEICKRKNSDYANESDPYANFRVSSGYGVHPVKAILIRVSDKLARIGNFVEKGNLENESVDDAILDVINYAILMRGLIHDEQESGNLPESGPKPSSGEDIQTPSSGTGVFHGTVTAGDSGEQSPQYFKSATDHQAWLDFQRSVKP
jgi:hypothetical protein